MTLKEKMGQMTQVDKGALKGRMSAVKKYFNGSVQSGASYDPIDFSPSGLLKESQEFQSWALKTRLKSPLIYGIDAVHGHNNVEGTVIFPHNIGLGATHNAALV